MSSVDILANARKQLNEAQNAIKSEARKAIKDSVIEILNRPGVTSVSWAQKASEYNDEGMYPGVFGPVLNHPYRNLKERWNDSVWYNTLYYYRNNTGIDASLIDLKSILDNVGEDILSDIFGDEAVVDAELDDDGIVVFYSEYAGV